MSYLKDREIWLSSVPTGNPPAGYVWVFIQNSVFVVRDSSGVDKIMATTTGTVTNATSASYVEYSNVANKPALISGSSQVSYTGLSNTPAGIVSGSTQVSFNGITDKPALVSSSAQIVGYNVFATTGSNQFNGSQAVTGSLTVTGQVVAQTLNVQQVTSSIVYSSGSNIFGNSLGNTQQFTGSLQVSGSSHYVLGDLGIGTTSPQAGLQIEKYGSKFDGDVQYNQPSGNVFFSATGTVANQDNWIGIRGNYNSSSGTSNLLLQANYRDVNSQAGHYISSKATAFGTADFIIGKLVTSTSTSTPPTLVPQLTIVSSGAATFASSVTATIFDSTSNAFRFSGNNALSLVSLNTQNVVKINAAGYWGAQLVGANDKGILVNNVGNVVIGTTSSGALLRPLNIVPATDIPQLYLVQSNNDAGGWMFRAAVDGHFRIISYQGSESPKLTIRYDTGNVGIGTDSPNTKLQIEDGFISTYHNINANGAGYGVQFYTNGGGSKNTIAAIEISQDSTARSGNMIFSTSNAGAPSPRMIILSGGNVGIGTTNPGEQLELSKATYPTVKLIETTDNFQGYLQYHSEANEFRLVAVTSHPLVFSTTDTERMRITTGGRTLLLGSSSSPYENSARALLELNHTGSALLGLRIGGSERAYFYHNNSHLYIEQMLAGASIYVISVSAGVYLTAGGTSWTSNSDERLKNINGNIENAVDKLMTLRTVNYSWKNDQNQKQNLGLIAQDVEKVFPQVIDLNKLPSKPNQEQEDNTEYLGVRYQELIPVLVKAIQELKSENDNLKSRLEVLEQS
jgi:hypothetical protein